MKLQQILLAVVLLVSATTHAQINLSSLLSEGASIFTSITSVLGQTPSTTATPSTTSALSSSSSPTSSPSPSTFSTSTAASSSSTPSSTSTPTSSSAAQSATPAADSGKSSNNTLAIVLGCTLGALALAAFLLLLFLCCRRRKKRSSRLAAKDRPLTPSDDGLGAFNEKSHSRFSKRPAATATSIGGTTAVAPNSFEHEKSTGYSERHDPFVPVLSANRDSLTRNDVSSIHRYDDKRYPTEAMPRNSYGQAPDYAHHENRHNPVAAGLGGAAVGGLAVHELEKRRSGPERYGPDEYHDLAAPGTTRHDMTTVTPPGAEHRRSGSVGRASVREPWPFEGDSQRRSVDTSRSGRRSSSRHHEPNALQTHQHHNGHALRDAAIGGVAGAAVARKSTSKSPHRRKGILKQTLSDSSDPYSVSSDSGRGPFNDRHAVSNGIPPSSGPYELGTTDYPSVPNTGLAHNHHSSSTAMPMAAAATAATGVAANSRHHNHHDREARRNSNKGVPLTPLMVPTPLQTRRRSVTPPAVPSRSPRRSSFHSNARYSPTMGGTAEMPGHSVDPVRETSMVSPPPEVRNSHVGGEAEPEAVVSPVSTVPSRSGTWSKANNTAAPSAATTAAPLGSHPPFGSGQHSDLSHESTVANYPYSGSEYSEHNSSGLLLAMHKALGPNDATWHDHNNSLPTRPNHRLAGMSDPPHHTNASSHWIHHDTPRQPRDGSSSFIPNTSRSQTNHTSNDYQPPGSTITTSSDSYDQSRPRPTSNQRHLTLMGKDTAVQDWRRKSVEERRYDPRLQRGSSYGQSEPGTVVGVAQ